MPLGGSWQCGRVWERLGRLLTASFFFFFSFLCDVRKERGCSDPRVSLAVLGSYVIPPFVSAQPVPCRCLNVSDPLLGLNANCTQRLEEQKGQRCRYPFPEEAGFNMTCKYNDTFKTYGWVPEPQLPDVFFPENVLLDFCLSNFFSLGNILVPLTSNVSAFREVDGSRPGGAVEPGGTLYGATIYNYGWLLVVLNNYTAPGKTLIPANATVLQNFYAGRRFDLSNRTQLWQSGKPGVKCQTITLSNFTSNTTDIGGEATTVPGIRFFDMRMKVFDQCNYDATIFIIVVASVGGAIIVATFVAAFVFVILAIKKSKERYNKAGGQVQYKEMDRGE